MEHENPVTEFLAEVSDQISYKPIRETLCKELEEHITDRVSEYEGQGMSPEEAGRQAVRNMGDALVIGMELNEVHRIRKTPALAVATVLLLLIGLAYSGWMQWIPEQEANGFVYYIPGGALLGLVIWKGYAALLGYRKYLYVFVGFLFVYQLVSTLAVRLDGYFRIFSVSAGYAVLLLFGVVMTMLLYHFRRSGIRAVVSVLALSGILTAAVVYLRMYNTGSALVVFLFSVVGTFCFMIHRKMLSGSRPLLFGITLAGAILIGSPLFCTESGRRTVQEFVNPEAAVSDTWDDTYNSILIQELLKRTPLTHGIRLTPEELMYYGTGAWYFLSRDPGKVGLITQTSTEEEKSAFLEGIERAKKGGSLPRFIQYTESDVTLWDILPQHYHNNYLIAVTIFLFGWGAGIGLLMAVAAFYVLLFSCIRKIRGRMASSVAFCCGMCLLWQGIFYILGNFGHQYAKFTNLPLISEGRVSIVLNMLFLGFIISAYRYDYVMEEQEAPAL